MACRFYCFAGREKGEGSVDGGWRGVFFAGADGGEAVDLPEVTGCGAGDCRDDFCTGEPAGPSEGVAD